LYDKRVVCESMNWKILVDTFNEGYHIGFLHRNSLREILYGNVADFQSRNEASSRPNCT
jgi:phenylpropionate dioxygenase-like ring-hydroxylating dioxygenase large terminal subunit